MKNESVGITLGAGIDKDSRMRNIASRLNPEEKQSKRTTFKLTRKSSYKLKKWARDGGTTIKEQFELLSNLYEVLKEEETILDFEKGVDSLNLSVRKTYVISKKAFNFIDKESKRRRVSRDIFVEKLIRMFGFLKRLKAKTLEESRGKHPEAYEILKNFSHRSDNTEGSLQEILSLDDPVYRRFHMIETLILTLLSDIEEELSGGRPVEPE